MRKFKIIYIKENYDLGFIPIKADSESEALLKAKKELKNLFIDIKVYSEITKTK